MRDKKHYKMEVLKIMINFNAILFRCNCKTLFSVFRCHVHFIVAVIIILAVSTNVFSADGLDVNIGNVKRSLEDANASIELPRKNLLLQTQNLEQLNRQILEIEKAYPKPRDIDVENILFGFEKGRVQAEESISALSKVLKKHSNRIEKLKQELNALKREQLRTGQVENAYRIADLKDDEEKPGPLENLLKRVGKIKDDSEREHNRSREEWSLFGKNVEKFRLEAIKTSDEANKRLDITYEKMLVSYNTMSSRGLLLFGGPPKEPDGYRQRLLKRRKKSASVGNQVNQGNQDNRPVYVAPKHASEQHNNQQIIKELEEDIRQMEMDQNHDPEELKNLKKLLEEYKADQNG